MVHESPQQIQWRRSGALQTQQQSCLFSGLVRGHLAAVFPREAGPVPREHQVILGWGAGPLFSAITWHLQSLPLRRFHLKAGLDQQLLVGSPGPSGEARRHPAVMSP